MTSPCSHSHPQTKLLLLLLMLQHRQTRQPSIELCSGHTKVNFTFDSHSLRSVAYSSQTGPLALDGILSLG